MVYARCIGNNEGGNKYLQNGHDEAWRQSQTNSDPERHETKNDMFVIGFDLKETQVIGIETCL